MRSLLGLATLSGLLLGCAADNPVEVSPPPLEGLPSFSVSENTSCSAENVNWDWRPTALVSAASVALSYLDANPPATCGDLPPVVLTPVTSINFTLTQGAWVRRRSIQREPGGLVIRFDEAAGPQPDPAGPTGRSLATTVNFGDNDLYAFGVRADPSSPTAIQPFESDGYNVAVGQYWSQVPMPVSLTGYAVDSGFSTTGPKVRLFWTNKHGPGNQFKSDIKRGPSHEINVATVGGTVTSYLTAVLADNQTYQFWIRHTSNPAMTSFMTLGRPNGGFTQTTINVPRRLGAIITGPDAVAVSGNYTWDANPSGGIPPYNFQWFFQGNDVRNNQQTYTRFIQTQPNMYFAIIKVTLDDAKPPVGRYQSIDADQFLLLVDPTGGEGGGPLGIRAAGPTGAAVTDQAAQSEANGIRRLRGLVDTDGKCVARSLLSRDARQELYWRIWNSKQDPRGCWVTVKNQDNGNDEVQH